MTEYQDTAIMEQAVDFNQTHGTDVQDVNEDAWYFAYAKEAVGRTRGYIL